MAMYLDRVKQPTGPTTPRRFRNGLFLMTVFADQQESPDLYGFLRRDPYWLPELMLYVLPPCENPRCGIGYPDFVETAAGDVFIAETDKARSRLHQLPAPWLRALWRQTTAAEVAAEGRMIDRSFPHPAGGASRIAAPGWGAVNLSAGAKGTAR
eukprot:gene11051-7370_t